MGGRQETIPAISDGSTAHPVVVHLYPPIRPARSSLAVQPKLTGQDILALGCTRTSDTHTGNFPANQTSLEHALSRPCLLRLPGSCGPLCCPHLGRQP
jgi:hypothetical protein